MSDPIILIVSDPIILHYSRIPKDDLQVIRDCTHKGWALGRGRFIEKVEALAQRRAASKGVGRPRKDGRIE